MEKLGGDLQKHGSSLSFGTYESAVDQLLNVPVCLVPSDTNEIGLHHRMVVGDDSEGSKDGSRDVLLRGKVCHTVDVITLHAEERLPLIDAKLDPALGVLVRRGQILEQLIDVGEADAS